MITKRKMGRKRLVMTAITLGITVAIAVSGCSSGGGGKTAKPSAGAAAIATQADLEAALQKETTLTMWGWAPQTPAIVAEFEKAYPKVKINLINNGSNDAEYTKLQNVIKAGSGVPDLAQLEYLVLPQFVLGKSLVDMSQYGVSSSAEKFTKSSWAQVNISDGIYGIPQDSGPLAMFYRPDVFKQFGIEVPKTWDEYIAAAKKLHAADPSKFIMAEAGDGGFTSSMIWQAGGHPYTVKGTDISVNLADNGSTKWANMWSQLVEGGLVDTSAAGWSPDWYSGMTDGKYATWIAGGWAAGSLMNHIPDNAGKWAVAPIPQYKAGANVSAEQGGSSTAVLAAGKNKLAAVAFAQWIGANKAANQAWVDGGGFPAATSVITSDAWLNKSLPYFNGQKINQVFADSVKGVVPGWNYLPFQRYANSVFADTVGQSYVNKTAITPGLKAWQKVIVSYGSSQGFTINK